MIINWKDKLAAEKINHNSPIMYNGGWIKKVISVDQSKTNGYAFAGEFLSGVDTGVVEMTDGIYIVCSVDGSRSRQEKNVSVWRVTGDELTQEIDWVTGRDWALQVRDRVADLLSQAPGTKNPLAQYSIEDLLAEIERRQA